MAHTHDVIDSGPYFTIDYLTRAITDQSEVPLTLMQYDHNSTIITFELARFIDGHDMSLCNKVEVHYINIGSGGVKNSDVYPVKDLTIDPEDESVVLCSWLISQNCTRYAGTLNFVVRYTCMTGDVIDYTWSTDIYKDLLVLSGIYNSEIVVSQYSDVLEQWKLELEAISDKIPYIGENGNWYIGDVDTGNSGRGQTAYEYAQLGGYTGTEEEFSVLMATAADNVPYIGENGNWYIGGTDTGSTGRGENGKSAYNYAQDGGYSGTEEEFAELLASDRLPDISDADEGKVLSVVGGKWAAVSILIYNGETESL